MIPKSLQEIQLQIKTKKLQVSDLVQQYLDRIEQSKHLNIYVEVYKEDAIQRAIELDTKIKSGDQLGALYGCIISVKDIIVQKGKHTTAASKILDGFVSPYSATALQRLIEEDAIIIGRTNCDEFGMGSANENSIYGPTKNGADPSRIPGGSSGGAAVSVQMNTCLIAIGSDTGGSVRQPAAFCGIYGLKPSYGRISRYGLIAYASSFDQIGILGHTPDDIGLILEQISGRDELDATSSHVPVENYDPTEQIPSPTVAYFPQMIDHPKLNPDIKSAIEEKIEQIQSGGGKVVPVDFQYMDFLVPTYYVLTTAEASTNLSRFDGVRYGYRATDSNTLEDMYVNTRTEGFGNEVKRRIMLGTYVLSEGYFDAYFNKAQKVRRLIKEEMESILENVDFVLLPTSTSIPWKIGELADDPVEVYLSDVFTVLANLTGLPSINIPAGTNTDGIPLGIQIISKKYSENKLLSFSKRLYYSQKK
ncbi:MAG: Asp-tRNA(Asn)/Glu-tRNA(Gln) amidotransferase subunit GatA [Saprospiraceae bacterium]|nr:Asp-tRNA(Asn)/Glu-tRNA(Gln) amidotransferase subunit GatA [Saprospiraceae bacterium]